MSLVTFATGAIERAPLPDVLTKAGIGWLCGRTRRKLAAGGAKAEANFARHIAGEAIAERPDAANTQHYEVPAAFFERVLGPRRKYSCCLYEHANTTLADAEDLALATTASHADLRDGQSVLELGCGWGSLTLWMAQAYPASRITAVSNSNSQRAYIEAQAAARGLTNLRVITADMNDFEIGQSFDRIVSVEMFEHMTNWPKLLRRVAGWLRQDGRLFIHVFTHRSTPYRFDTADKEDWIAQHFFTGGIMPSHGLLRLCADTLAIEEEWRWSGTHYARTARDWLANFDRESARIDDILVATYGADAALWKRRWRLFFLATAGLFGHAGGSEWGVSHYRLRPA
jgi:cyclopropane-fatty-acyl-phospholipid synthase